MPAARPRPAHCEMCKRPLRDVGVPKVQAPDSVTYGSSGVCMSCRTRLKATGQMTAWKARRANGGRDPEPKIVVRPQWDSPEAQVICALYRRGYLEEIGPILGLV